MDKLPKNFLSEDFLLQSHTARLLFNKNASKLPIIDYHCHLSPTDIANDRQFNNLTEIWLDGDHYKWRVMRMMGIKEKLITGEANPKKKFAKWAQIVPYTLRNPLYHWTHLELKRYFDIDRLLTPETAEEIYEICNDKLKTPEFSTRSLIRRMDVKVICTTDDPVASLEDHSKIVESDFEVKVLPTFRPDSVYDFKDVKSYNRYLNELESVTGINIKKYDDLLEVIFNRIDYFDEHGCQLSDHGLSTLYCKPVSYKEAKSFFKQIRKGKELTPSKQRSLRYSILLELSRRYKKKGWVQQFHLGALRNTNDRMVEQIGPDTGYDSIGDFSQAEGLTQFFNQLDRTNQLPRTIIYNLNPKDNAVFATMIGNFNEDTIRGKMQYGSAWWFLDQKDGIENQLNVLSKMGLLSCFIGMLTDSRSFLSYPRHEYFRRILCNLLGKEIENGQIPKDLEWVGKIISDICYYNAKSYFKF